MRQLWATAFATLLAGTMAAPAAGQSYIGLMAGPTISSMTGSFIEQSDGFEWGVHLKGTFGTRLFGDTWLQTGVGFIQKGGSKLTLSTDDTMTYGFTTAYLQVPFLIRQEFHPGNGPWALGPIVGLSLGSNTGCKTKPGDELEFPYSCADSLPGGDVKSLELALPVGLDVWIEFPGASRFMLEARYEIGLTNVLEEAALLNQSVRQNVLVVMFGFTLPLFVASQ
jgi:Outer membrane protein beta-barrel domain